MDIALQPLSLSDFSFIAHLHLEPDDEAFAGGSMKAIFDALRASRHPDAEHPFAIVAEDVPVGFLLLREQGALPQWAHQGVVTLHMLRVGRAYQGRGYAKAALTLAADWIARCRPGVRHLMLTVNKRNDRAIALYLQCGFVDTGEVHQGRLGAQIVFSGDVLQLASAR